MFEFNDNQFHDFDDEDFRQLMSEFQLSEEACRARAELPQLVENVFALASYESDASDQALFHDIENDDNEDQAGSA